MKKITESILLIIATFIISFILNSITQYLQRDLGSISIGSVIQINGQNFIPIDIYDYDNKPVENLQLSIPKSSSLQDIVSSRPIQINEIPSLIGTESINKITISNIDPNSFVEIMIPISDVNQYTLISVLNAQELKFASSQKTDSISPLVKSIRAGLMYSIINAIIYGIFVIIVLIIFENLTKKSNIEIDKIQEEYNTNLEKSREMLDQVQNEQKEQSEEAKEAKKAINRIKLLLLARVSEYDKELTFWRDTIRKVIYDFSKDKDHAENIIKQITNVLETYHIQEKEVDFDAVITLAELMTPKKTSKKN